MSIFKSRDVNLEYDFEALVAMLMNENLKGNYDDAASSLNSLYRMLYTV